MWRVYNSIIHTMTVMNSHSIRATLTYELLINQFSFLNVINLSLVFEPLCSSCLDL